MPIESSDSRGEQTVARNSGFVLVSVLWALALLAVFAASLTITVQLNIKTKTNILRRAELQLLADGLARLSSNAAVVESFAPKSNRQLAVDGRQVSCSIFGKSAAVEITDTVGLVDLNAAPAEMLAKIATYSGLPRAQGEAVAAAILDYRDGDDVETKFGAETEAYSAAGRPFGPKNAPFESVVELDQVLGLSLETYERIAPLVTVYSRQPYVDLAIAPLPVIQALNSGENASRRASLEREFETRSASTRAAIGGRAFDIRVQVSGPDGSVATRHAVVEVMPQQPMGFVFREWDLSGTAGRATNAQQVSARDCVQIFASQAD